MANTSQSQTPVALTIAGSDSGGNAGIQADLRSFAANGVHGTSAITCLTAQNPLSVSAVEAPSPSLVAAQISQVFDYYAPSAVKTGMLWSTEIVEAVADALVQHPETQIVVDPVMIASSGQALLSREAERLIRSRLLPLATLITPNLDEAAALLDRPIDNLSHMRPAAQELAQAYHANILLKGGHMEGNTLVDIIATTDGELFERPQARINSIDTHGSGCTLSAASAAWLAKGATPLAAIDHGLHYLRAGMEQPLKMTKGSFINHQPR